MNRAVLRAQLTIDEGCRLVVYKDSLGYLTVGIGHLITKDDTLALGDIITASSANNLFDKDLNTAIAGCNSVWPDFDTLPDSVQEILANMAFNLGESRLRKFKRLIAAIDNRNWTAAAVSMKGSLWYTQVGNRAKRLVTRMEAIEANLHL